MAIRTSIHWGALAALVMLAACSSSPGSANAPPVLDHIGARSVAAGNLLTISLSGSDADGDTLTFSTGTLPSGATFNASTKAFSWTPTAADVGTVNVVFNVSDGEVTVSETVVITVTATNSNLWDVMIWDSGTWN